MLFNSIQYLLFLPIVVAAFWLLPRALRPLLLLVASYYFYMSWMASYGILLAALTLFNFFVGIALSANWLKQRRILFIAGIAGNLGCLMLYKYTNFFIETFWSTNKTVMVWLQQSASIEAAPVLAIILPLGISFFVFEFIHYLTDIYRGEKAIKDPIRFGLFAAFFPSQIAGPIKRFEDFDSQVVAQKPFDAALFKTGLWLIVEGMFKKVVLGDNLAQIVQPGFANSAQLGTLDAWVCVAAFTLQIYYDFSGYTDIGRGSAMLLGFRLPENFNMPYIARNLSDFWHRWHISLSTWLRDYLYIPMGGSKSGKAKQSRNLVLTMLLGGLWHGASWHYVVWGAFHGLGLVLTHTWQKLSSRIPGMDALRGTIHWDLFSRALTLFAVMIGWVVFRAENMTEAGNVYAAMFTPRASTDPGEAISLLFIQSAIPAALALYVTFHIVSRWWRKFDASTIPPAVRWWLTPPMVAQVAAVAAIAIVIVGFAPQKSVPFIYFQF